MAGPSLPEPWLRGTLPDRNPIVRAVVHALELAREDLWKWCFPLSEAQLNDRPGGIGPVAFHLRHIARSLDRLLTYAEGAELNEEQLQELKNELEAGTTRDEVFGELDRSLQRSRDRVMALDGVEFSTARSVGKKRLPTTVGGLLVHVADHTQRHVGQAITTAKIASGR